MNYYSEQQILAHVCPFCRAYQLEAPATWDTEEVQAILGKHIQTCTKSGVEVFFKEDASIEANAKKAGFMR